MMEDTTICQEEEDLESLDDLEKSILLICNEPDVASCNADEACAQFHLSPSKLEGIQLPIYSEGTMKRIDTLSTTPLNIAGLSPIHQDKNHTPARSIDSTTPTTLKRKWHSETSENFSSTPCSSTSYNKKLKRNEESRYETLSEIGETFEELLQSVSMLCDKPQAAATNNVSKIDLQTLFSADVDSEKNDTLLHSVDEPKFAVTDENFFRKKTTSEPSPRFKSLSVSRPLVEESTDDEGDLSEDILGLENYIVLDNTSDDDLDLDLSEGEETLVANETLVEHTKEDVIPHDPPLRDETVPSTLSKIDMSATVYNIMSETVCNSVSAISNIDASMVGNRDVSAMGSNIDVSESSEYEGDADDELDSKRKKTEESATVICENSDVVGDDFVLQLEEPNTFSDTEDIKSIPRVIKQVQIKTNEGSVRNVATVTPLVHEVRIVSPPPTSTLPMFNSTSDSVIELIMVEESIQVVDLTDEDDATPNASKTKDVPVQLKDSKPKVCEVTANVVSKEIDDSQISEEELMKKVKLGWGTDGIHDINNNLTVCGYIKQRNGLSVLEGNSRVPPLLKSSIHENDIPALGHGKTASELAAGIKKQIASIDLDCVKKINSIENGAYMRVENLKRVHRYQVNMLGQKQHCELRNASTFILMNPISVVGQYRHIQLREDHVNQRDALRYRHNNEIKHLLHTIVHDKDQVWNDSANAKYNLEQMISKLEATGNQHAVDPDRVHTTVDLIKGPCKNNHNKESLVQVCLPADIASYMIREDEVYNMYYKY